MLGHTLSASVRRIVGMFCAQREITVLRRRCVIVLLGVLLGCKLAVAQQIGGLAGPQWTDLDLHRLPPVELLPAPAGETPPSAVDEATQSELASPDVDMVIEEALVEPVVVEEESEIKLWEGTVELGLNGTQGNTETLDFRFGTEAKRKTKRSVISLDFDYSKKTTQQIETASRAFLDWRCERLFHESPWSCFVHGTVDYDEFKMFDVRVAVDIGLGRQLVQTESTSLAARMGAGFSHEIDSPDESYVPEAVFGLDFEHRLNSRQKLSASAEYTPDVTAFADFRLQTRAGWELLIDKEMNLSLKLSVLDRYDSTANGAKPNDLDYSAVVLWKF